MAHDEQPTPKQNVELLQFKEHGSGDTGPALADLSGVLYLSGSVLHYRGSAGTITQLAQP
jgi:hypothetical protein